MSKTLKNCFYSKLTFEKMLQAHNRAKLHKSNKDEIIKFEFNLENNLINLVNSIRNGTYKLGNYFSFKIYEPKERIIKALPYKDRIVHQWYVEEFIKPFFIPKFINTSFACLENRGTHKAVLQVQKYLRVFEQKYKDYWILKCDIKGFFYNIDQNILFNILKKQISDKALLKFTKLLVFNNSFDNNIGIPIGNLTSQYFANIYLNELDYYVKHNLKIKAYVRYMDDFILLAKTKKEAKNLKFVISNFLAEHLHLELNHKSRYYPSSMGVNFCGYRIFSTHRLLRQSSKKKIKKKIKKWNHLYKLNKLNIPLAIQSLNSWKGHISHCNSYNLEKKTINKCNFIFDTNHTYELIEKEYYSLF